MLTGIFSFAFLTTSTVFAITAILLIVARIRRRPVGRVAIVCVASILTAIICGIGMISTYDPPNTENNQNSAADASQTDSAHTAESEPSAPQSAGSSASEAVTDNKEPTISLPPEDEEVQHSEPAPSEIKPDEEEPKGITLKYGELLSVYDSTTIESDERRILVIKAKISSSLTNKMTVSQNYQNVQDVIKNQGFYEYDTIEYWAVADMTSEEEEKVISFTLEADLIAGLNDGSIAATQIPDIVGDLFIHESLTE